MRWRCQVSPSVIPHQAAFNDRYARFSEYQSHPDRFDAVLFGSSRSGLLPFNELSRDLGEATLANFGVACALTWEADPQGTQSLSPKLHCTIWPNWLDHLLFRKLPRASLQIDRPHRRRST